MTERKGVRRAFATIDQATQRAFERIDNRGEKKIRAVMDALEKTLASQRPRIPRKLLDESKS